MQRAARHRSGGGGGGRIWWAVVRASGILLDVGLSSSRTRELWPSCPSREPTPPLSLHLAAPAGAVWQQV